MVADEADGDGVGWVGEAPAGGGFDGAVGGAVAVADDEVGGGTERLAAPAGVEGVEGGGVAGVGVGPTEADGGGGGERGETFGDLVAEGWVEMGPAGGVGGVEGGLASGSGEGGGGWGGGGGAGLGWGWSLGRGVETDGGEVALVRGGVGGEGGGERVEIALAAGGGLGEEGPERGDGPCAHEEADLDEGAAPTGP